MASAPLLGRRREIAGVIVVAGAAVAVLGYHYAGQRRGGRVDTALDVRVRHRLDGHLRFLHHLVAIGDPASVIAICAVLAVVLLLCGRRRAAVLTVLGPALAAGFTELVLKPLIDRRIDDDQSFSPSGHTTGVASVAVVVLIALLGPSRPPWPRTARWTASALVVLGAIAVATALVGSGYHYATDTLGGFCVAVFVVLWVAWSIDEIWLWVTMVGS